MNRYEKYSDSNLLWVKEVPEHWDIRPISHVFEERTERNYNGKNNFILSVLKGRGVIPYTDKGNIGNKASENINSYKVVYPNDLVLNSMNMMIGSLGKSNHSGVLSQVYYVLKLMNVVEYDINYLSYLFQNRNLYESFRILGKGILDHRLRVPIQSLKYVKIPIPPIEEQEQIANYLDWKINEIDRLIQVEKKKIKELELFKQKYIDLQIESIDCEMQPLKSIFDFGKGLGITKENLGETGFKCISYGEIHNDFIFSFSSNNPKLKGLEKIGGIVITNFAQLKKGDFVFADTSEDLKGCGNFTFLEDNFQKVYAGYHTVVAKPIIKFKSKYLVYYFQSNKWRKQIRKSVKGIKVYSITQQILKSSKVQIPDEEVQTSITDKLDKFIGNINSLRDTLENSIKELMNLKQSLISEVVTGKIDVTNILIPEYEKVTVSGDEMEEFDEMEDIEDGD
jgi:TYPE I RESTRICTION-MODIFICATION SYSTEM SPECIFICITY SUBUNIT